jgi:hypothetical protein
MIRNLVAAFMLTVLATQDSSMSEVARKFRQSGLEVVESPDSVRVIVPIVEVEEPLVSFYSNGSNISEKDSKQLEGLIAVLKLHPEVKGVRIEATGLDMDLATRRASKVCSFLSTQVGEVTCAPTSVVSDTERKLKFFLMKE